MKKVLLLNPPGDKIYLRDYFCSKVSKSGYLYHPTDLLVLSGRLAQEYDVHVLDAIAEGMDDDACVEAVRRAAPGIVIFLTGSVSFGRDVALLKRLRDSVAGIEEMIGIGDVFFEACEEKLRRNEWLDAVLYDFTTDDVLKHLAGEPCRNVICRSGGDMVGERTPTHGEFTYPVPVYDLFPNDKYNYPFATEKPFAVVLTNFGCPFKCRFCIMPELGFKHRPVENAMAELRYLKEHGFGNIYFNDQTFGANRGRTRELLEAMIDNDIGIGWLCFSRADVMTPDMVALMKRAGCHTILFGVESSSSKLLGRYEKGITPEDVRSAVASCREQGVRTVGTFMLGLPGETRQTALETIAFACDAGLDYATFNIAIPRMGTQLRTEAIEAGRVSPDVQEMDQSGSEALIRNDELSLKEIEALHRLAYRKFYLRPGRVLRMLRELRSPVDLYNHVRNGLGLIAEMANCRSTDL